MTETIQTWRQRIDNARAKGLAAREYFIVFTEPAKDRLAVQRHLGPHLEYQRDLEKRGIIVAAGPLSDERGEEWTGKGMIIYRAEISPRHAKSPMPIQCTVTACAPTKSSLG